MPGRSCRSARSPLATRPGPARSRSGWTPPTAGTTYSFRLRAHIAFDGFSDYSNVASCSTPPGNGQQLACLSGKIYLPGRNLHEGTLVFVDGVPAAATDPVREVEGLRRCQRDAHPIRLQEGLHPGQDAAHPAHRGPDLPLALHHPPGGRRGQQQRGRPVRPRSGRGRLSVEPAERPRCRPTPTVGSTCSTSCSWAPTTPRFLGLGGGLRGPSAGQAPILERSSGGVTTAAGRGGLIGDLGYPGAPGGQPSAAGHMPRFDLARATRMAGPMTPRSS